MEETIVKKFLSLLLCLLMIVMAAVPASAASYLNIDHIQDLVEGVTSKKVEQVELDDGTVLLVILYENDEKTFIAYFEVTGTNKHILKYSLLTVDEYSGDELTEAYRVANQWNRDKRYPRLYVGGDNCFEADNHLFCTADVTDDMITEFVDNQLRGTKQLFQFMADNGYSQYKDLK